MDWVNERKDAISTDTPKGEKMTQQTSPFWGVLKTEHAPNGMTDGTLEELHSDLYMTALLNSMRSKLTELPEPFYWIQVRQAWGAGNDVDSFIFQELPASSHHIVVHQQEARTHCTSIGSDNGSKDFILISNGRCVEMPDDVTGSLTLFTVSPDPFTSGRCVQGKPTLNCEKHEVPILVFYGKCN